MDLLERIQRRTTKMIQGVEHFPYEDRVRQLWGELRAAFQYLKGDFKKEGGETL